MNDNNSDSKAVNRVKLSIIPILILIGLYFISLQNYLMFHGIVELTGIAVTLCIFIIVWNTRKVIINKYFLIIGISFLFFGSIDLIHTLAYKGMRVFPGVSESDLILTGIKAENARIRVVSTRDPSFRG